MVEHKMALFVCDKSVALHAAQLGGQRTAVHAEVVGQLLTVERNVERVRAVLHRLRGSCVPLDFTLISYYTERAKYVVPTTKQEEI